MTIDNTIIPSIVPTDRYDDVIVRLNDAFDKLHQTIAALNSTIEDIYDNDTLDELNTFDKTSIIKAINSIQDYVTNGIVIAGITGALPSLLTTNKSTLVAAINELVSIIGDSDALTTDDKTDIVSAINELKLGANSIGDLTQLLTTNKLSAIGAINELVTTIGQNNLNTVDSNIVDAVNTLSQIANDASIGVQTLMGLTSEFLLINGGRPMAGNLDMDFHRVINVKSGTNANDAVSLSQMTNTTGDTSELLTTNKSNLTSAINELVNSIISIDSLERSQAAWDIGLDTRESSITPAKLARTMKGYLQDFGFGAPFANENRVELHRHAIVGSSILQYSEMVGAQEVVVEDIERYRTLIVKGGFEATANASVEFQIAFSYDNGSTWTSYSKLMDILDDDGWTGEVRIDLMTGATNAAYSTDKSTRMLIINRTNSIANDVNAIKLRHSLSNRTGGIAVYADGGR